MNERIKQLREALGLSQEALGEKIGLTRSGISNIENGLRSVSDRHVILLCSAFCVSEQWLRTGEGDMFAQSETAEMEQLASRFHLRPLEKSALEAFVKLPEAYRDGVMAYIKALVASVVEGDGEEYRALVERQAERENQMLREHPAFDMKSDDNSEAHA